MKNYLFLPKKLMDIQKLSNIRYRDKIIKFIKLNLIKENYNFILILQVRS